MKIYLTALALIPILSLAACSKTRQDAAQNDAATTAVDKDQSAEKKAMDGNRLSADQTRSSDMFGATDLAELLVVNFPFDSSTLTEDMQAKLRNNANFLRENPQARIVVEGHTDERGPAEYNIALGERRAKAVRDYLQRLGIDSSRMETVSYGSEMPVNSASNEKAWSENRRANFRSLNK
jgi:peptidoglycan-associated lipoprotein